MPAIPKPRPRLLEKRDRASVTAAIDRAERAKCRQRSGGRCEVITVSLVPDWAGLAPFRCVGRPCFRQASENHHLLGDIGRRNRGASILAAHRIDVCKECHAELHGHVLQPVGEGREDAATVCFERVK